MTKNIQSAIMIKDTAPTELIFAGTADYYKGFAPTELFAFSKIGESRK